MSVLLAQELEEAAPIKPELPQSGKKRTSRKSSREKQQNYGSKDSIKIVNEIACKEVCIINLL